MLSCDAVSKPTVRYLRRYRKTATANGPAGSSYLSRIVSGERCLSEAVVTKTINGHTVRRCLTHLSSYGIGPQ